jgi:DNA repair exonuclease SbcCD ATPase subunit
MTDSNYSSDSNSDTETESYDLVEKELDKKKQIKWIFHLADIHIRLYARHQEYKEVFQRLYNYLNKQCTDDDTIKNNGLIVICGDLLHSKSELSPNCINIVSDFLKTLSNILPTIVIMGNHDINLGNKNHLDALSPIINNLNIPTLHYLTKSGVYHYGNISFVVTSILNGNKFINIDTVNAYKLREIKIALYHGVVSGSSTDVGSRLNSEICLNDFKGFTFALLGDIHKVQYVGGNTSVCYPGSLICQNYGEDPIMHGLMKWNIIEKTSRFVKIKNDYGYITLNIVEGEIIDNITIPDKPRIRIMIDEKTKDSDVTNIIQSFRKKYEVQEIIKIHKHNKKKFNKQREIIINTTSINNNNDYNYDAIIKSWLEDKKEKDGETINRILKINKKYVDRLKEEISDETIVASESKNWDLKRLIFSNMFSYGDNNIIDFNCKGDVVGIFAFNGYGKSSIIDILLFSLFDKCSRGNSKQDIMNTEKNEFVCQVEFEIGNYRYFIQRFGERNTRSKTSSKTKSATLTVQVKFWKENLKTNEIEDLSGSDRTGTNRIIQSIIGTYDDLVSTCISLQNNHNSFTDLTQAKRKDFLNQLLKIKVFELLYIKGNNKKKELSANLKYIQKNFSQEEQDKLEDIVDDLTDEKEKQEKILEDSTEELTDLIKQQKKIEKLLIQNESGDISDDDNTLDLDELKEKLKTLEKELDNVKDTEKTLKKSLMTEPTKKSSDYDLLIKQKHDTVEKIIHEKASINIPEISECNKSINNQHQENIDINDKIKTLNQQLQQQLCEKNKFKENPHTILNKINNQLSDKSYDNIIENYNELQNNIRIGEETVEKLNNWEYDPDCEYCIKNEFVQEARKIKKQLPLLKKKIIDIKKLKIKYDSLVKQKEIMDQKCKIYDDHINNINNIMNDLCGVKIIMTTPAEDKMLEYCNVGLNGTFKLELYENKINKLKKEIDHLTKKQNEIRQYEMDKVKLENIINNKNKILVDVRSTKDKIFKLSNDNTDILKLKKRHIIINKNIEEYKNISESVHKKIKKISIELALSENKLKNIEKQKEELDDIQDKLEIYKLYCDAMSKDGIPNMLLHKFIPIIVYQVNEILSLMCDFTIFINNDGKDIDVFIVRNRDEDINNQEKYSAQTACGFEKFIINIAFRVVFSRLSCLSKPNIFIVDEMISSMDNQNKNNISVLFEFLKMHFDTVIIISHLEELRGSVDNMITLTKKNGCSRVNNTKYNETKKLYELQFESKSKTKWKRQSSDKFNGSMKKFKKITEIKEV